MSDNNIRFLFHLRLVECYKINDYTIILLEEAHIQCTVGIHVYMAIMQAPLNLFSG